MRILIALAFSLSLLSAQAAENSNAENLLVIRSPLLADVYFESWAEHQKHSVPYEGRDR